MLSTEVAGQTSCFIKGINSWEPVSVVAVKMVKPQADITYIKVICECGSRHDGGQTPGWHHLHQGIHFSDDQLHQC